MKPVWQSMSICSDDRRAFGSFRIAKYCLFLTVSLFLTGCSGEDESADSKSGPSTSESLASRWYTAENVARGAPIYAEHCAECHGKSAQGSFAWQKPGADGKLPPPPLDGTAHAWHHPIRALGSQIKFGAPGGSGTMPGFEQTLSDQDIVDVIAWFQDKWSDEIYAAWLAREQQSRKGSQ